MAIESITKTLGSGSGIDITALVASLVEAQYSTKTAQLTAKSDTLTAQISGVAKVKSGITGFDAALRTLVKGGTLTAQPTSSNDSVVTATALAGAKLSGFSARIEVQSLASAQAATTNTPVARTAGFPAGTLTLRVGTQSTVDGEPTIRPVAASANLTIAAGTTIEGIAAQINATRGRTGLIATVVNDGTGARLTIKGASGAAQAFDIVGSDDAAPTDGGPSLSSLSVGRGAGNDGMTIGTTASDASVLLDGARFTRPTNTVSDLIDGVRLDLTGVSGTAVTLGSTSPTANLSQAVSDFVSTYNAMLAVTREATNPATGVLKSDTAATGLSRSLSQLTTTVLAPGGTAGPRTLADLGVATARDGSLSVDSAKLKRMLATYPDAVEAMFADGAGASGGGISAALGAIATRVTDQTFGLDASTDRYAKAKAVLADTQSSVTDQAAAARTRMTQQFSRMDAKVAAYKATQTFLTNQVAAWNKGNG